MNDKCLKCEKKLSFNEIGLYRKMVNRGAEEFLCISCLAEKFKISEDDLQKKIEYFRKSGCTLFSPMENK